MPKSLLQQTLDSLGSAIVAGRLPAGHVVPTQDLEADFGVSRSVMKEAVRVLHTLGMVSSVKRVGVRVLPSTAWNYFDPLVMRWRLESDGYPAQLRSLNELRGAIEPVAADLAARYAPDALCSRLLSLAAEMRAVVRAHDVERFIEIDVDFHNVVLVASGNEMFAQLRSAVGNTVSGRSDLGLLPNLPDEESLQLHVSLADAIQGRRPEEARAVANKLVGAIFSETAEAWASEPRIFGDGTR
ncbi:FadR/GntR family transcriptional regulator [Streptomyces sp. NPDC058221]|uniref:FadR/GntR family transcriptional regulator n=1 Tax=Streptomyces sp. NPDC058221 TaxID=3346388 RepID=UPI0036E88A28